MLRGFLRRFLNHQSRGFILVEIPLSVALLAIVVITLFEAQGTAYKASYYSIEQVSALTLAQSENISGDDLYPGIMGYVHTENYSAAPWNFTITSTSRNSTAQPSWWDPGNNRPPLLSEDYTGYKITVNATALSVPYNSNIQKITVTITHTRPTGDFNVIQVVDYNTNIAR